MRRTQRDAPPEFAKLAWLAQRPHDTGGLAVLQDALLIHYGRQFKRAIQSLRKKRPQLDSSGEARRVLIFSPQMERAVVRNKEEIRTLRRLVSKHVEQSRTKHMTLAEFGKVKPIRKHWELDRLLKEEREHDESNWPFMPQKVSQLRFVRPTAVVVWDPLRKFNTHHWVVQRTKRRVKLPRYWTRQHRNPFFQ